jgi:hypothetical protein
MTTMATTENNTPDVHTSEPEPIPNDETSWTFGMALVDDDGWAYQNPAPQSCTDYLVWTDGETVTRVGTALLEPGTGDWIFYTHTALVRTEGGFSRRMQPMRIRADADGVFWAEARAERPIATLKRDRVHELQQQLAAENDAFTELNDNLNELADSWGCCPDYEAVIVPLGLFGRNIKRDYDVTVRVTVKYTDPSPSVEADRKLEDMYGLRRMEATEVTFTGTFEITVSVGGVPDESEAKDAVTRSDVRNVLDEELSGEYELEDWSAESAVESD